MSSEPWILEENPAKYGDYNWWSDDVPARKFYRFIAEVGLRLRHLMTDENAIQMIELCEQCADGRITEDDISDLSYSHRPGLMHEPFAVDAANNLY